MTQKVGGIEFDVVVDASGVSSTSSNVQNDLTKLSASFQGVDTATGKTSTAFKKMVTELQASGRKVASNGRVYDAFGMEVKQATAELERLARTAPSVSAPIAKSSNSIGRLSKNAGQAGIQIQQFAGQLQGGQSAMLALSQQAADLGIVLGAPLIGAAVGLSATLAATLLPSLFDSGEGVKNLREELEELAKTQLLTVEQAKFMAATEKKSVDERQKQIEELEKEIQKRRDLIKAREAELNGDKTPQLLQRQSRYRTEIKEANEFILEQDANLSLLNKKQEEAKSKLDAYNLAIGGNKKLTDEQKESVDNIKNSLTAQIVALQGGAQAAEVYAATQNAIKNGTESALPGIIDQINAKYELIRANKEASESEAKRIESQKQHEKVLDEIFAKEQARKDKVGTDLEQLRERLKSEEQIRAEAFLVEGEQLREALEMEEVTKAEFDALEKERVAQHQQWLIDKNKQSAQQRLNDEKQAQAAIGALQRSTINNAIGLLDQFAGESKVAALASIALTKGLAIAQTLAHTQTAAMLAYSSQLIPGDPSSPARAAAAYAKTQSMGKVSAALIAATGLAQAGSALSGGGGGAASGGVPATNTTTNRSDTGSVSQQNISINLAGSANYTAGDIRGLIDAINDQTGDGYNLNVTGG